MWNRRCAEFSLHFFNNRKQDNIQHAYFDQYTRSLRKRGGWQTNTPVGLCRVQPAAIDNQFTICKATSFKCSSSPTHQYKTRKKGPTTRLPLISLFVLPRCSHKQLHNASFIWHAERHHSHSPSIAN